MTPAQQRVPQRGLQPHQGLWWRWLALPPPPGRQHLVALASQAMRQLSPDMHAPPAASPGTTPFQQRLNSGVADPRPDSGTHQQAETRTDPDAPRGINSRRQDTAQQPH